MQPDSDVDALSQAFCSDCSAWEILGASRSLAPIRVAVYGRRSHADCFVKRALITGCSTGIGRATAVELTRRGYEVVATARRRDDLGDLDVARRLALDVTSDRSVDDAVAAAGDIDVLVNNAGISVGGPIEKVPLDRAKAMFETNVWGAARMIQALAPGMRARNRGAIVNVTSAAGRAVGPLNGYYSASKWALEALSEAIDLEFAHWGIKVIVVEPGQIATPMFQKEEIYGSDAPPYDELARICGGASSRLSAGNPPGPEVVAAAIADALERDDSDAPPPCRRRRRDGRRGAGSDELRGVRRRDARGPGHRLVERTCDHARPAPELALWVAAVAAESVRREHALDRRHEDTERKGRHAESDGRDPRLSRVPAR